MAAMVASLPSYSTAQRTNSGEMLDRDKVGMEQKSKGECQKQKPSALRQHRSQEKAQQGRPWWAPNV